MRNNRKNNNEQCAIGVNFEDGSCIRSHCLIEYANSINKNLPPDMQIKMDTNKEILQPKKYKKYLITEIDKRMSGVCSDQICWTRQENILKHMKESARNELEKLTFKPEGPNGQFTWLNNFNINDVMHQFEIKYPDFQYLGTLPMDFNKELITFNTDRIRKINQKKLLENNIEKIGAVFNLDKSTQKGSHWVGFFANIKNGEIYFFDSYGTEVPYEVRNFMKQLANEYTTRTGKKPIIDRNRIRHQYGNSECGVYSMNFIDRMLYGESFEDICKSKTPDSEINKMRKVYFRE